MELYGYVWRKLAPEQRKELLDWRRQRGAPWHRPPHRCGTGKARYHLTAACFEHRSHIGLSPQRLGFFSEALLELFAQNECLIHAWCVLPNHYHAVIETHCIAELLRDVGRFHGRTSYHWNGEEQARGRQVWCGAAERTIRNNRHFWASVNYVHNNPVHHGYATQWQDWAYSSAVEYLDEVGKKEAARIWKEYPVLDYGRGWDAAEL
jgi:putative transposase